MTTDPITPAALAAELDADPDAVDSLVDQLVAVDGRQAVYADADAGTDELLLPAAADFIREQLPASPATSGTWATIAEQLEQAAGAHAVAEHRLDEARGQRDDAIRAARADGWAVTDIARALGVTRQAVYDALDRR